MGGSRTAGRSSLPAAASANRLVQRYAMNSDIAPD
jgi:hypothetical protein